MFKRGSQSPAMMQCLRSLRCRCVRVNPMQQNPISEVSHRHGGCLENLLVRTFSDSREDRSVKVRSMSAGLPDWVEKWSRQAFKKVGYGLAGATALTLPFAAASEFNAVFAVGLSALTTGYWYLGLQDIRQTQQTVRRNFPVLGRVRYILESFRPEIRQYFIEQDLEATPYSRAHRTMAYSRSKGIKDKMAFGARVDTKAVGYEYICHSLYPSDLDEQRPIIGKHNPAVSRPYSTSLLNISAMSYGALSDKAIYSLSCGAKLGGFSHNTGEGGVSSHHLDGGGDLVWNIGTGYFGCGRFDTDGKRVFDADQFKQTATKSNVKMIEIKLSQGAKPAHGGVLPKDKISPAIAEARNLSYPVQNDCVSPPYHSAFKDPNSMCDWITELRTLSGGKPVGIKMCMGYREEFLELVETFASRGNDAPDFITIDGGEGGTGSAPPEFSDHVGAPLIDALPFAHAALVGAGLRDPTDKSKSRIALIASGKILSGFSICRALALGADSCNAARSFLFSLGCIQALKCHTNKCPTGITTMDPDLTWGLDPTTKQVRVANFQIGTVNAALELLQATGVPSSSNIQPHHIIVRTGLGEIKTYAEVYDYLTINKGDLLLGKGPHQLLEVWERRKRHR